MDRLDGLAALAGVALLLAGIANNRRLNPNLRFVARFAEGDVVQDLETGLFHLIF